MRIIAASPFCFVNDLAPASGIWMTRANQHIWAGRSSQMRTGMARAERERAEKTREDTKATMAREDVKR